MIDKGIFIGYSSTKKAYRCYNIRSHKIIESASVIVDDTNPRKIKIQDNVDDEETDDEEKDEDSQKEEFLKEDKDKDSIREK